MVQRDPRDPFPKSHLFDLAFVEFGFGVKFKTSLPRHIKEHTAYFFFSEAYDFQYYVQAFNPF